MGKCVSGRRRLKADSDPLATARAASEAFSILSVRHSDPMDVAKGIASMPPRRVNVKATRSAISELRARSAMFKHACCEEDGER